MPSYDMDTDRPKSREDAILTENTDDFIIGDRVWVNGTKPGYIQYLGETRFSPGDWAGVVLDDYSGKTTDPWQVSNTFRDAPTPPPLQRCLTPTRTPSPGARNFREGDRVSVTSASGPPKTGLLRYLGQTDFAAGEWAGIELDEPMGKNDGTVAGKRYFRCSPNYGLFSPSHKVTKIAGSLDRHRRTHHTVRILYV
ncbi:CAP-Gly domain-containing linker protein 2 [Caerostris extrusa]|uniref:CAP-Gly domain-containing linker protein 2 n=1 Tax=Caerostris extrusa TaxID=172846 RepID=A0AAV4PB33_CAEEX|nr:CAP-Gly domain-containing linker protein 2 [Caerostris extrusa]